MTRLGWDVTVVTQYISPHNPLSPSISMTLLALVSHPILIQSSSAGLVLDPTAPRQLNLPWRRASHKSATSQALSPPPILCSPLGGHPMHSHSRSYSNTTFGGHGYTHARAHTLPHPIMTTTASSPPPPASPTSPSSSHASHSFTP